jgi:hypothetical protein
MLPFCTTQAFALGEGNGQRQASAALPRGKSSHYPLNRFSGSQNHSCRFEGEIMSWVCREINRSPVTMPKMHLG